MTLPPSFTFQLPHTFQRGFSFSKNPPAHWIQSQLPPLTDSQNPTEDLPKWSSRLASEQGAIVFDFDGVLADTQKTAYEVVCQIADRKQITHPTLEFLKNHRTQEILRYLNIRWWQIPYYLSLARRWTGKNHETVTLFPWAKSMVASAQRIFPRLWIVSSNTPHTIEKVLEREAIPFHASQIRADISVFGKTSALKKLIKQEGLNPMHVGYVGDETRDIEAAHAARIRAVGVTWGYQSAALLRACRPEFLVEDPREFEAVLMEILVTAPHEEKEKLPLSE